MAKQRYVNTRFWDDDFVIDLDPIEKLLFLYILTNPLTEIAGAYEITLKRMAFDTGIDKDMIQKILKRFEDAGKVVYKDGWLLVVNFTKHQSTNPKIEKGIETYLTRCPDWISDRLSKPIDRQSHLNRDRDRDRDRDTNSAEGWASESVFQIQITEGVKKEFGLRVLSNIEERAWFEKAELAHKNGFTASEFLECLSLLRQQAWRSGPVSPEIVHKNLPNLSKLRDEIKQQLRTKPDTLPTIEQKRAEDAANRKHIIAPPKRVAEVTV